MVTPDYLGRPDVITRALTRGTQQESEADATKAQGPQERDWTTLGCWLCRQRKRPQTKDLGSLRKPQRIREQVTPGASRRNTDRPVNPDSLLTSRSIR